MRLRRNNTEGGSGVSRIPSLVEHWESLWAAGQGLGKEAAATAMGREGKQSTALHFIPPLFPPLPLSLCMVITPRQPCVLFSHSPHPQLGLFRGISTWRRQAVPGREFNGTQSSLALHPPPSLWVPHGVFRVILPQRSQAEPVT